MSSEQRGFVFSVVFIIVFSGLLASVPVGLQGPGETPDIVTPIDPSILTAFSDGENYTKDAFSAFGPIFIAYQYTLGGKDWICATEGTYFTLAAKILFVFLWFGHTDSCKFISSAGPDRGETLTFSEIDADAENGTAQYDLEYSETGTTAGGFIAYWNTTAYSDSSDAWDNDELYLLHGIGLQTTATNDIGALIVSLLLLQLPEVPTLINLLLAVPIWACIIYVLWFIIKEMIPFV